MPGTYFNLNLHVIFSTRGRMPVIAATLENDLYRYISGIIHSEGGVLIKIGGTENHIHILLKLKPSHCIPELVKRIKGKSSRWINSLRKTEGHFLWQEGYGVFSVSESKLTGIIAYIANQKKHHNRCSFEDEFVQMLNKHNIDHNMKDLS